MKREFDEQLQEAMIEATPETQPAGNGRPPAEVPGPNQTQDFDLDDFLTDGEPAERPDVKETYERNAIRALRSAEDLIQKIKDGGAAFGEIKAFLKDRLPESLDGRDRLAYELVPRALNEIFGPQDEAWHSYLHEQRNTRYVRTGKGPERG